MVGGLIEEQEIGLEQEHATERDTPSLTTGEHVHIRLGGRQTKRVHRDLKRVVEVPAVARVDVVLQLALRFEELVDVGVRVAHLHRDVFELRERIAHRLHGLVDDIHHRAVLANVGLLLDEAH